MGMGGLFLKYTPMYQWLRNMVTKGVWNIDLYSVSNVQAIGLLIISANFHWLDRHIIMMSVQPVRFPPHMFLYVRINTSCILALLGTGFIPRYN